MPGVKDERRLREGFSTGACAAAAAKAASMALIMDDFQEVQDVSLEFPDGKIRKIPIESVRQLSDREAISSVIKDAGDDPDVTHGIRIMSMVKIVDPTPSDNIDIRIEGGEGVGMITKPGLGIEVGRPAINPVPCSMIRKAVASVLSKRGSVVEVTVMVPEGKKVAEKTLNKRLGIVGGISILGTTGIVKPISEAAWCATISISMDVALAAGLDSICLSTGRSSEEAAMKSLSLQEEAFISMGDYVGFSLKEAAKRPFRRIYLACQWSKLVKMAMGWNHTHVRFGALEPERACKFIEEQLGFCIKDIKKINTVRQLLGIMLDRDPSVIESMCRMARERLKGFLPAYQDMIILLVSYDKEIIHREG